MPEQEPFVDAETCETETGTEALGGAEEFGNLAPLALSALEAVQWIEPAAVEQQMNANAKRVLRGDYWPGGGLDGLGLTGRGEVVGVADSGIDVDHCFFWDDAEPRVAILPSNSSSSRKIQSYWPIADAADERDGHGTHVGGSILGKLHK